MWRSLLATLVLPLLSACGYNTIQSQDEQITASWAEVVNQYQRRADLIPNLVETVRGFANQEQEVLIGVTEARAEGAGGTGVADARAEGAGGAEARADGAGGAGARAAPVTPIAPDGLSGDTPGGIPCWGPWGRGPPGTPGAPWTPGATRPGCGGAAAWAALTGPVCSKPAGPGPG